MNERKALLPNAEKTLERLNFDGINELVTTDTTPEHLTELFTGLYFDYTDAVFRIDWELIPPNITEQLYFLRQVINAFKTMNNLAD
ncbi:MAG: hypothetical protein Q4G63_07795 [Bacteroidia bacterium]|nr:hypothetical protein [Bacteroidia bacterium]